MCLYYVYNMPIQPFFLNTLYQTSTLNVWGICKLNIKIVGELKYWSILLQYSRHPSRRTSFSSNCWDNKGIHTFPKRICPKVNLIARREFELTYYDSAGDRFNHYTMMTPRLTVNKTIIICKYRCLY